MTIGCRRDHVFHHQHGRPGLRRWVSWSRSLGWAFPGIPCFGQSECYDPAHCANDATVLCVRWGIKAKVPIAFQNERRLWKFANSRGLFEQCEALRMGRLFPQFFGRVGGNKRRGSGNQKERACNTPSRANAGGRACADGLIGGDGRVGHCLQRFTNSINIRLAISIEASSSFDKLATPQALRRLFKSSLATPLISKMFGSHLPSTFVGSTNTLTGNRDDLQPPLTVISKFSANVIRDLPNFRLAEQLVKLLTPMSHEKCHSST
jgi:hypothetical protein